MHNLHGHLAKPSGSETFMSKSTISTFQLFTFRLNVGDVKRHTLERLDSFVVAVVGKRLTYKELTA